jgi:hypothetical protein
MKTLKLALSKTLKLALSTKSLLSGFFMAIITAFAINLLPLTTGGALPSTPAQWVVIIALAVAGGVSYLITNLMSASFWSALEKHPFWKGIIIAIVMAFLATFVEFVKVGAFPSAGAEWMQILLSMVTAALSYYIKYAGGVSGMKVIVNQVNKAA